MVWDFSGVIGDTGSDRVLFNSEQMPGADVRAVLFSVLREGASVADELQDRIRRVGQFREFATI